MKNQTGDFITANRAEALAKTLLEEGQHAAPSDPVFSQWRNVSVGTPVLVRTLTKEPSYWIVPIVRNSTLVGFVRVLGSGRILHYGIVAGETDLNRTSVTGISPHEALSRVAKGISAGQGEVPGSPVLVHDGPMGREAWLIEVTRKNIPVRWIFITPAFVYERAPGTTLGNGLE
jgi:hypothetical protein